MYLHPNKTDGVATSKSGKCSRSQVPQRRLSAHRYAESLPSAVIGRTKTCCSLKAAQEHYTRSYTNNISCRIATTTTYTLHTLHKTGPPTALLASKTHWISPRTCVCDIIFYLPDTPLVLSPRSAVTVKSLGKGALPAQQHTRAKCPYPIQCPGHCCGFTTTMSSA